MVGAGGRTHVKRCGCCRKRKGECDGNTPACQRCIDHGLQCLGYEKKLELLRWSNPISLRARKEQSNIANGDLKTSRRLGVDESGPPHNLLLAPTNGVLVHSLEIPQNKLGLITVLHGRYVPGYHDASNREGSGMCSSWITTAYSLVSRPGDSEMLSDSLLAMSFSLIGLEHQHNDLSMSGLRHYAKALKGLRTKLAFGPLHLDDEQMDTSLITCLACGMYEVIANHSYSSLLRHLEGIGALLQTRGVENITSSSSRRTFYEYRSIKLSMDLATRRACFLSMPDATNLQTVSDIAFRIPLVMEKLDHTRSLIQMRGPVVEWDKWIAPLDEWGSRLSNLDSKVQFYTSRPASTIESPVIGNTNNIYATSFDFPNWDNAASFVYHAMSQIYTNSLLIDLECMAPTSYSETALKVDTLELMNQSIECADRICQSIEYFLEDNKKLIGRMVVLAPFKRARSLFSQLSQTGTGAEKDNTLVEKVRFCEAVTQRIKDSGLPIG
ncbi:hypothetical protein N431DRAFT_545642 [Stipitochalara longipes BDJ]|nr:hypothetical protein N431DRAFT_545642 [Stipitochalara longipes BDJ]